MKKSKELDIDFIGGQSSLTKEQEKMISEFLKSRSLKKRPASRKPTSKRKTEA
jgi:hypothetical protein